MTLYRRGELASVREGMVVAGVPRQTIHRWLREAGLDLKRCRLRWLARQHERAERQADQRPRLRPSRHRMRQRAERAVREFNEANARR